MLDIDSFLVTLYVIVDDWWEDRHRMDRPHPGRPPRLSAREVLTLAIAAPWPFWHGERQFHRTAWAKWRSYFPGLCGQSQFHRRCCALEPEMRALHQHLVQTLDQEAAFYILDSTLIPVMQHIRATRHGWFAGQAAFGRCASRAEWVYGFKVALVVSQQGVIRTFGLAAATADERHIGEHLLRGLPASSYLADKGYRSKHWQAHCRRTRGAMLVVTPKVNERYHLPAEWHRWTASKRQRIEQIIDQMQDDFGLVRHGAHTLLGLLTRLAAKVVAFTIAEYLNRQLGRPLRHLADLVIY